MDLSILKNIIIELLKRKSELENEEENAIVDALWIMKMVYIIEREGYINYGKTFTGNTKFYAMKHGTVVPEILDMVTYSKQTPYTIKDSISIKKDKDDKVKNITLTLQKEYQSYETNLDINLSNTIDNVWYMFSKYDGTFLRDVTHCFGEWEKHVNYDLEWQKERANERFVEFDISTVDRNDNKYEDMIMAVDFAQGIKITVE